LALSLLSVPLNAGVLEALEDEPLSLFELRRRVGSPPQTTMRGNLRSLTEAGILERSRQAEFPGSVDFALAPAGRELLEVAEVVKTWLGAAPEGGFEFGSAAAKAAIKALLDAWSAGIIRALAAKPLALTELSRVITCLSYPSLERRLAALRLSGQIQRRRGPGRRTPYAVTDWMRQAIGPITAAARWERLNLPSETEPVKRLDVESAFLLLAPRLKLPSYHAGACRLAVELRNAGGEQRIAGVVVRVENGRIVSCVSRMQGQETDAWVGGPSLAWLRAVVEHEPDWLEIGGDCGLAQALLDGFHDVLFGARQGV
jgi:DNA-binding HxlR family transcriptional regulator